MTLAYLATPYTKYKPGIEAAFIEAAKLAARLTLSGVQVYSPIAHTHPLAVHGGIDPLDLSIWLPFDEAMMKACDVLIVAHMDGWEESKGIAHEVKFFEQAHKPVYDLDPDTMKMVRRSTASAAAIAKAQARLAELDSAVENYPRWGAALGAMDEERRSLKSFLRRHQVTDDPLTARSALMNPKSSDFAHDKTPSEHAGSSV